MDELKVSKVFDYGDINMVWAKDKILLNRGNENLHIDYIGLASYLGLETKELNDFIQYNSGLRTALAYYLTDTFQIVKVFDLAYIPHLFKVLRQSGINPDSAKKQLEWMITDIKREELK
jgi:hypothetical protein